MQGVGAGGIALALLVLVALTIAHAWRGPAASRGPGARVEHPDPAVRARETTGLTWWLARAEQVLERDL